MVEDKQMDDSVCKECSEVFNDAEQVRRHLRKHGMTFQQYSLKWTYGGIEPVCKCGCGQKTGWNVALKSYTEFVHGHHAKGRKKSDDEKRRIGEKNSTNMKRFMIDNPDVARLRGKQLRSTWTPEREANRVEATKQAYAAMSNEDKQGFIERAKQRWESGDLAVAHEKAAKTYRQRFADGQYDFAERNQRISETVARKYIEGGFEWSRGSYVSTKTGRSCYYRSAWELTFMKELDADEAVTDWESEFTTIPYELDGITHRYVPDLRVVRNGVTQLVEIKPMALRDIPKNAAKREAALEFCKERGWEYVEWEPDLNVYDL